MTVSKFTAAELAYLRERRLGRLATIDATGLPHVVPLGWTYNADLDTVDIGGRNFARTAKFRNVTANPKIAFVVDDVLPPWQPRAVMIRGRAEALLDPIDAGGNAVGPIIRIHPTQVLSWGLDDSNA